MTNPTIELTETLQKAFDHFNKNIFGNSLPACMITLSRKKSEKGYFRRDNFESRESGKTIHEIALNPETFVDRNDKQILSTLAHDMVHMWQFEYGDKPPKTNGYHNREWAIKARSIGLIPFSSTTGDKGTGAKVTHEIKSFGAFDTAASEFIAQGNKIEYQAIAAESKERKETTKYTFRYECPKCDTWAKAHADSNLVCGKCLERMVNVDEESQE